MRRSIVLSVVVLCLVLACGALAADSAQPAPATTVNVALNAQNMQLDQAVASLAKQSGMQIVCDTGVQGSVNGNFASINLEKLLDLIVKSNNLVWQKIYMPAPTDPNAPKPTIAQMKARAEAITAVTSGTIVVYDPATGKQKVFVEQDQSAPKVQPDKLGLTPTYIISTPKVETAKTDDASKDAAAQFKSVEDQRMKLMAQMTSDQRVAAMQQETAALIALDPATRQQVLQDQMKARQTMDPALRDQLRQVMRDSGIQGGPGGGGWGGRQHNRGGGGNNTNAPGN